MRVLQFPFQSPWSGPLLFFVPGVISAADDPAVLNMDNPVAELRQSLVVGDHHDGLVKLFRGQLQKPQNLLGRPAVQIPRWQCSVSTT